MASWGVTHMTRAYVTASWGTSSDVHRREQFLRSKVMSFAVVHHFLQEHVVHDFQSTVTCSTMWIAVPLLVRDTLR